MRRTNGASKRQGEFPFVLQGTGSTPGDLHSALLGSERPRPEWRRRMHHASSPVHRLTQLSGFGDDEGRVAGAHHVVEKCGAIEGIRSYGWADRVHSHREPRDVAIAIG